MNKQANSQAEYHILNYMEELVAKTLNGMINKLPKNERPSSRTQADIKALALNRLWPMYVTTPQGKRFVKRDVTTDRIDKDVNRETMAAYDLVSQNPR